MLTHSTFRHKVTQMKSQRTTVSQLFYLSVSNYIVMNDIFRTSLLNTVIHTNKDLSVIWSTLFVLKLCVEIKRFRFGISWWENLHEYFCTSLSQMYNISALRCILQLATGEYPVMGFYLYHKNTLILPWKKWTPCPQIYKILRLIRSLLLNLLKSARLLWTAQPWVSSLKHGQIPM